MEFKIFYEKPIAYIKHIFITGLIFLLPVTITFVLLRFFFALIKGWLVPIRNIDFPFIENVPHHEIVILLMFVFVIGILIKMLILNPIIHIMERFFSKIPLVKTIYHATKQLVHAFTAHDEASFKKVVIIEFPRQGMYSIGFLTKEVPSEISDLKLYGIYVPHTPNPATGSFVMLPASQFTQTDLTRQEATALVISGGILQPNRFKK
jgi:uncharacterized membrane protein